MPGLTGGKGRHAAADFIKKLIRRNKEERINAFTDLYNKLIETTPLSSSEECNAWDPRLLLVYPRASLPVKPAARQLRQFHQFPFTCRRREQY
jgi:hypothetical protein